MLCDKTYFIFCFCRVGIAGIDIAGAALTDRVRHFYTVDLLEGVDYFKNAVAVSRAEVIGMYAGLIVVGERLDMTVGEPVPSGVL